METLVLYTTWPSDESAKTAARTLVEARLVACANCLPASAVYRWEGRVVEENEVVMLLKTSRNAVQKTIDKLRAIHPYTNPCVLVLPIEGGSNAYMEWIARETASL